MDERQRATLGVVEDSAAVARGAAGAVLSGRVSAVAGGIVADCAVDNGKLRALETVADPAAVAAVARGAVRAGCVPAVTGRVSADGAVDERQTSVCC